MKQIITILILIGALNLFRVNAQDLPTVCSGAKVRYGTTGVPGSVFDWEILGGTIFANYNDSVDVLWNSTAGIKTIKVTEHTKGGCSGQTRFGYVMVSAVPKLSFENQIAVCQGYTVEISPKENFKTYRWSSGETSKSIYAGNQGWYKLQVTDDLGCSASDSVYLTVNRIPYVNIGDDIQICDGTQIILNAGNDGVYFEWFPSNSTSQILMVDRLFLDANNKPSKIGVKVTDQNGCINADTVRVLGCENDEIPNTFTPNGDQQNDTWVISMLDNYPNASVQIYDRWGRLVYSVKNGYPAAGWDGRSKGKDLPMDSYYYIIKLNDPTANDPKPGTVTIVR